MRVLSKEELDKERIKLVRSLRECLFIHPTDTVYGIGCNATDRKLVHKLRSAKEQFTRPVSILVPSKDWIRENCEVDPNVEDWLDKLPGPYTLILKLKNPDAIARNVNLSAKTIGVRLPNHWITDIVSDMRMPIVTTSANITGRQVMTNRDNLNEKLKKSVEYIIYDGKKEGKASMIVNLTDGEEVLRD
ncbi:L-threonylcarbamoyladenylate synthase [Nanoarchaeota archaeon]